MGSHNELKWIICSLYAYSMVKQKKLKQNEGLMANGCEEKTIIVQELTPEQEDYLLGYWEEEIRERRERRYDEENGK